MKLLYHYLLDIISDIYRGNKCECHRCTKDDDVDHGNKVIQELWDREYRYYVYLKKKENGDI